MFGFPKKKLTIEQVEEFFPKYEKALKIGLYQKLAKDIETRGLPEETSKFIAAQGINYIYGGDWESTIDTGPEEGKLVMKEHKADVIPFTTDFFEEHKDYRELIVNYLRVKATLLFARQGDSWFDNPIKVRIEKILLQYGREFPEEADPDKFMDLAMKFFNEK